jgi:hypothetical protein
MDILYNDSIPLTSWKAFIDANPYATPFQSPEFYKLFNSVSSLSAEAIAISDLDLIKALAVITLQKEQGLIGYFSRRAIIYGGPLISDNCHEALGLLLESICVKVRSKAIYIESRNFSDYDAFKDIFHRYGLKYVNWLNLKIVTKDIKSLSKGMSSSRLRQIRKALKTGVKWEVATNQNDVLSFYDILVAIYNKKIGKPLLPIEFFMNFFECGFGKYLLIWYNNRIIGGIMCPILEKKAIYEFYVCGLDEEYKEQYPSVMATWAAMEYANQNGIPLFDFMGAGKPDEHYGVRDFKARFGGELVEYGRFIKINNHFLYRLGKLGLKLSKVLPK